MNPDPAQPIDTRQPPHDIEAEQAVLGLALQDSHHLAAARTYLTGPEFYRPAHEQLWAILTAQYDAGQPTDPITINAIALNHTTLRRAIQDNPTLIAELYGTYATPDAAHYARTIAQHHRSRLWIERGNRITQMGYQADPEAIDLLAADQLEQMVQSYERKAHVAAPDIDTFLGADTDQQYNWLIPNILEHGDRIILTAEEGAGKSHLGRQIAVQTAAGIHPFTGDKMTPARVLILDLENPANLIRREIRAMRVQAGDQLDPDNLRIESRTQGIDLADTPEDRDWLTALVTDAQPDLLITGPIYKMADGDPNEEKSAKPVALYLDRLRAATGCAIWLEAHVGNETQGKTKRPTRPFGWSGWRRWPEFGLFLDKDGELTHWRGDRDQREWPSTLLRGGTWPFRSAGNESDQHWLTIRNTLRDAGQKLSNRELARRTGIPSTTVDRLLKRHSTEYIRLCDTLRIEDTL
jgi:hypothetical protein